MNLAIDARRLESFLGTKVQGLRGPLTVSQFAHGQSNPTYLVQGSNGDRYVLRRKPPGVLLPSAHAVDREFRVMKALRGANYAGWIAAEMIPPVPFYKHAPEVLIHNTSRAMDAILGL